MTVGIITQELLPEGFVPVCVLFVLGCDLCIVVLYWLLERIYGLGLGARRDDEVAELCMFLIDSCEDLSIFKSSACCFVENRS